MALPIATLHCVSREDEQEKAAPRPRRRDVSFLPVATDNETVAVAGYGAGGARALKAGIEICGQNRQRGWQRARRHMIGITCETRAKKAVNFNMLPSIRNLHVAYNGYCKRENTLLYSTRKMSIIPELPWLLPLL
jgi:hypothetical protein